MLYGLSLEWARRYNTMEYIPAITMIIALVSLMYSMYLSRKKDIHYTDKDIQQIKIDIAKIQKDLEYLKECKR